MAACFGTSLWLFKVRWTYNQSKIQIQLFLIGILVEYQNNKTVLQVVKNIILGWGIKKQIIISKTKKFKEDKLLMISNKKQKKS